MWGYGRYTATRPAPTPTWPPDDGSPAQSQSGLQAALYSPAGQKVSGQAALPAALPISLSATSLSALDALAYPEGAFFDAESGQLIVFGPPAAPQAHPASDDFLVALRAVYNQQTLAVSIDPTADPQTQNVRYEGPTAATHLGWVMFEADRRMKTLSMGQDNLTNQPVSADVPGYANMLDLELAQGAAGQNEVRRRFWFTVPQAEIEQAADGRGMIISALRLAVKTEYLDANWQTLASQPPDPVGKAFAAHLTENYSAYARQFPVLTELETGARWTALAHWLYQTELPFQPQAWLTKTPAAYDTPQTTPAITVTRQNQQENSIQTLQLWGGVDLTLQLGVKPATPGAESRLKAIADQFRATFSSAAVEDSLPGLTLAPLASAGLEQLPPVSIQISSFAAPPLVYENTAWKIQTPRLKRYGEAENSAFLLDDPRLPAPVVLTFAGRDTQSGGNVFTSREAGYWLTEFSDGYELTHGQFLPDGSYSHPQGQLAQFNLDGQILNDTLSGAQAAYTYQGGNLTGIVDGSQRVEMIYEGGQLREIHAGADRVTMEYQAGRLTQMTSGGQPFRKLEYDSAGRLLREINAEGQLERQMQYDAHGRILYRFENEQGTLYDWQPDGALRQYSGPALTAWREAAVDDLEELKSALRLKSHPQLAHLLFARKVGQNVLILADERSFTLPAYLLTNPARLRSKLAGLMTVAPGERVLVADGNLGVAFQSLFPQAIPLTVETMDERRVSENLAKLDQPLTFTPQTASVLNGIPLPDDLPKVKLNPQDASLWAGKRDEFSSLIAGAEFAPSMGSAAEIQSALAGKASVLLVVAHSDGTTIYLPDGSEFTPESLTPEQKQAIGAQSPLVILLSCETGAAAAGQPSFAQQLLETGPRMVVSPNGRIALSDAQKILKNFLQGAKTTDPVQAIFRAIQSVYPNWLLPSDDGLDHFFEFRTQNFSIKERL